jgi:hypothetical protein
MLKVSEDSWAFPLLSPHNFSGEIPYRYCRETPCTGLGQAGIESLDAARQIPTIFNETHLNTEPVTDWAFLSTSESAVPEFVSFPPVIQKFISGISISPFSTHSTFGTSHAKEIVLSPAWVTNPINHPRKLTPSLAQTLSSDQITSMVRAAHDQGKTVSLHPQILFPDTALKWWQSQPTSEETFWLNFLTEYRGFINQYADLAATSGVETLILGGEWIFPALPVEDNFQTYSQPGNIETIWAETIQGVRERFSGTIGFVLSPEMSGDPPAFLSEVDVLYLLWDQPLDENISNKEMLNQLGSALDEIAEPLVSEVEKPLVILLAIPSLQGYHQTCIPSPNDEGDCVDTSNLMLGPAPENPAAADLQMQADYYYAFLSAVTEREWIAGVISQGYFPELALHDSSTSIHGKPAEEIFERWLMQVSGN